MNIYDISEKSGVSIATVSRVINGSSKVSEATRNKVLSVMKETGYEPNIFARGLGLRTMHTVGILCADASDAFLAAGISYLEQQLHSYQYDLLLCCTGYDIRAKRKYMDLLLKKHVDAIILLGSNFIAMEDAENAYIFQAAERVPVILINGMLSGNNIYCAYCDDYQAVSQVTKQFLSAGKKELLFLGRAPSYSGIQKKSGFTDTLTEAGELEPEQKFLVCKGSIRDVKELLLEKWKTDRPPEAVLTSDDELAIAALKAARELGIKVPEELEIVGYNNSKYGICSEPEITSVENRLYDSCENAVEILMQVLDTTESIENRKIDAELILRESTISLNNGGVNIEGGII